MVYVISAVPGMPALAMPLVAPIDTTDALLVLHVPPVGTSVKVVVAPVHRADEPDMLPIGLTVIERLTVQLPMPYTIVPVPPEIPVIMPVAEPIVKNDDEVLQTPPATPSVAVIWLPAHTVVGPPIAVGASFTVTVTCAEQPPTV